MKVEDEHLHFEILKTSVPQKGDHKSKMDPGRILGFDTLSCKK
jgi:hypothetical protein